MFSRIKIQNVTVNFQERRDKMIMQSEEQSFKYFVTHCGVSPLEIEVLGEWDASGTAVTHVSLLLGMIKDVRRQSIGTEAYTANKPRRNHQNVNTPPTLGVRQKLRKRRVSPMGMGKSHSSFICAEGWVLKHVNRCKVFSLESDFFSPYLQTPDNPFIFFLLLLPNPKPSCILAPLIKSAKFHFITQKFFQRVTPIKFTMWVCFWVLGATHLALKMEAYELKWKFVRFSPWIIFFMGIFCTLNLFIEMRNGFLYFSSGNEYPLRKGAKISFD